MWVLHQEKVSSVRLSPEALKLDHVACVRKVRRNQLALGKGLRLSPGAERSRDSKRAGYGVLTEQARDKNLLLSHSPAHRIILHIHPAGLFGRSSQLKSGLCGKLSEFV